MDYLSHYGVKGMKWGIRKSYQRVGRKSANVGQKFYKSGRKFKSKLKKRASYKIIKSLISKINEKGGMDYINRNSAANKMQFDMFMTQQNYWAMASMGMGMGMF